LQEAKIQNLRESNTHNLNYLQELDTIDIFEEIMTNSFQRSPRIAEPVYLMNDEMNQELTDFILEPVETGRDENRAVAVRAEPAVEFQRQTSHTQDHISTIMQGLMDPSTQNFDESFGACSDEPVPTLFTHIDVSTLDLTPEIASEVFRDVFNFTKCKKFQPEIEYPEHVLRANGISFVSKDGRLFATNRGKDNKHIFFGLGNFDRSRSPGTHLLVYLSVPGKHDKINACAACVEKYDSTEFMEISFRGQRQQKKVTLSNGASAIVCPIVETIGEENNRIYHIKFNCFTSHLKDQKTDRVKLIFGIVNSGMTEQIWDHKVELEVTANPGRDSGCFVPAAKRKVEPGLPVNDNKRPKLSTVKTERTTFEFLSPAAKQMIASKMQPEHQQQFMANMNRRFFTTLDMEIEMFCSQQNATG